MKHIALIAAYDRSRAIGKNGKIPWNIAGEQQRFRQLTTGQTVIFGRRTYEEIGHPLPCRETIVVSRQPGSFPVPICKPFPRWQRLWRRQRRNGSLSAAVHGSTRRQCRWRKCCISRRSTGSFKGTCSFRRCWQDSLHESQKNAMTVRSRMCM